MDNSCWNDIEINTLLENYQKHDVLELQYMIKTKTQKQIESKLYRLNLSYKQIDRTKYHNLNEVFRDYKRLLNNQISKFKKDYILQYDIFLFKYYLKINNISVTKDYIYNIHFVDFLKKAKLWSRIKKKWHSCFEFISQCFPKMKLKEYNFKTLQVREGFWDKDYNCFDMINYGIEQAIKDSYIKSSIDILLFNLEDIYKYFHKSMIYYRGVGIFQKYFICKNINIIKIKIFDDVKFDSCEELNLYKHLKNSYNIYKNNKVLFVNDNERYKPDFFILYNNIVLIIEYFGLFKNKPNNDKFIKYKEKTLRKIKYFNNLDNYKFIAIFPKDLNNRFKGVDDKLTSFLYAIS